MFIQTVLLLACSGDVAPEESTGSATVDEGCSSDSSCPGGTICEAEECIDGDRNNSPDEAEAILWDSSVSSFLNPVGDIDYYRFSARGGEYVRIITSLPSEYYDTILVLRDPTGQVLTWSDDFPTGSSVSSYDSVIYAYLPYEGEYLISVEDYHSYYGNPEDSNASTDYEYSISLSKWDQVTAEPDEFGDASLSLDLDAVNMWNSVGVHINEEGDSDWIEINYTAEGSEGISPYLYISGVINLDGSALSPQVRLRDAEQNILSDFVGVGSDGSLLYPNMTEGTYWVEVKDENERGGEDYWTYLFLISRDSLPYPVEEESNNSAEEANEIELTPLESSGGNDYKVGKYFGEIDAGDEDWFSFSHDYPDGQIILCLNSTKYGSTTTPFVQITDSAGNIVVEGLADGDDENFAFQDFVSETGEYFISVRDENATGRRSDWYQFLVFTTDFDANSYTCP